jgi:hypothetical protein
VASHPIALRVLTHCSSFQRARRTPAGQAASLPAARHSTVPFPPPLLTSSPSAYVNCVSFFSTDARSTVSPARHVFSTVLLVMKFFSLLRTKAAPLPGLTCRNSAGGGGAHSCGSAADTPPAATMFTSCWGHSPIECRRALQSPATPPPLQPCARRAPTTLYGAPSISIVMPVLKSLDDTWAARTTKPTPRADMRCRGGERRLAA